MITWQLEEWITDIGAEVLKKRYTDQKSLSPIEELIYEIWLLDTESRNGGLSQYFGNHGIEQWKSCCEAVASVGLLSFADFEDEVNSMIAGMTDPYREINSRGDAAEDLWYSYQNHVVKELQLLKENVP